MRAPRMDMPSTMINIISVTSLCIRPLLRITSSVPGGPHRPVLYLEYSGELGEVSINKFILYNKIDAMTDVVGPCRFSAVRKRWEALTSTGKAETYDIERTGSTVEIHGEFADEPGAQPASPIGLEREVTSVTEVRTRMVDTMMWVEKSLLLSNFDQFGVRSFLKLFQIYVIKSPKEGIGPSELVRVTAGLSLYGA